jgi:ADP-heptose:LPS heptosyltransferase
MFIQIRNVFNFLIFLFLDFFIGLKKQNVNPGSLLFLRFDSIGDYLLFRNFLAIIREEEKYKNCKITLCGNIIWKELAETLDSDVIDEFIWMDRKKFLKSISYKFSFLKKIHSKGFETVINSTYTRELLFGDQIVKASRAIDKIGNSGSPDKKNRVKIFSNGFYTKLIPSAGENIFEFYRNKEFFENLLARELEIENSGIDPAKLKTYDGLPEKYCVIFPGANDPKRRWNTGNFAEICEYLIKGYNLSVVIPLSASEKHIVDEISGIVKNDRVIDLSGEATLSELAQIIAGCEIVISNDTAAVHFAAAVKKKFLCITSGLYYGRFLPYPESIFSDGEYIFPQEIAKNLKNKKLLVDNYRFSSDLDINSISAKQVKEKIRDLLG